MRTNELILYKHMEDGQILQDMTFLMENYDNDYYNMEDTDTLHVLTNFQTIQQSTEWTCGCASVLMTMNWFGMSKEETDISLAQQRQNGEVGGTYLEGMKQIFDYMNDEYDQDWVWVSTEDLDDPDGEESYVGRLVRPYSLSARSGYSCNGWL